MRVSFAVSKTTGRFLLAFMLFLDHNLPIFRSLQSPRRPFYKKSQGDQGRDAEIEHHPHLPIVSCCIHMSDPGLYLCGQASDALGRLQHHCLLFGSEELRDMICDVVAEKSRAYCKADCPSEYSDLRCGTHCYR